MVVPVSISGRAELGSSLFLELPDAPSPLSLCSQQCQRCESIISASPRSAAPTLAPGRRRGLTAALSGATALLGSAEDVAVCPSSGGRLRTRGGTDAQTDGRTDGLTDGRRVPLGGASFRECPWLWECRELHRTCNFRFPKVR